MLILAQQSGHMCVCDVSSSSVYLWPEGYSSGKHRTNSSKNHQITRCTHATCTSSWKPRCPVLREHSTSIFTSWEKSGRTSCALSVSSTWLSRTLSISRLDYCVSCWWDSQTDRHRDFRRCRTRHEDWSCEDSAHHPNHARLVLAACCDENAFHDSRIGWSSSWCWSCLCRQPDAGASFQ